MSGSVVTHKYNLQSKNYELNAWKPTTQIQERSTNSGKEGRTRENIPRFPSLIKPCLPELTGSALAIGELNSLVETIRVDPLSLEKKERILGKGLPTVAKIYFIRVQSGVLNSGL